jgi:CRP-like cAMP-binding protein
VDAPTINITNLKVACSSCNLRELCLPVGLTLKDIDKLDEMVATRKRVKRGDSLFRAGDRFESLYAVRLGFLKSTVMSQDGREQVTGFHMAGELVGLDGISTEQHSCDTVALEDTEVCVIPYERLEDVATAMPVLRNHFHKVMSREIVREHGVMLLWAACTLKSGSPRSCSTCRSASSARLFALRVRAAHDARRNRQLPWPEARNRQPRAVALRAGQPDRREPEARADHQSGGFARHRRRPARRRGLASF